MIKYTVLSSKFNNRLGNVHKNKAINEYFGQVMIIWNDSTKTGKKKLVDRVNIIFLDEKYINLANFTSNIKWFKVNHTHLYAEIFQHNIS